MTLLDFNSVTLLNLVKNVTITILIHQTTIEKDEIATDKTETEIKAAKNFKNKTANQMTELLINLLMYISK